MNHYLDILVPKEETRSDWLQRPLTAAQLDYAALDVIHLLQVYELQVAQLEKLGRADWVTAECVNLASDIPTQIDPEDYYLKVKNLWRFDRQQLFIFKQLCAWRERTARDRNLPRNRVIDEKALFQIAALNLSDKKTFRDKAGVTSKQLRFHGEDLESLISEWQQTGEDEHPARVIKAGSPISNQALKALKQVVESCAKNLNVAPEMLAKRRHLEQLLRSENEAGDFKLPAGLLGWREAVIGAALLREVAPK